MGTTKQKIDMLNGPVLRNIILFALPLAAGSVLQQLFNSVDVAVVGRFVGNSALAAVGSNAPVISLLVNLFMGVSMGANVVVAHHLGQKDEVRARQAVNTISLVAVVSGFLLAALGISVSRPILELIDTPPEVLDQAVLYLRIYFAGMPFFMVFNFGAAILRSVGDTRRPLYILVAAGVVNALLNLFFVLVMRMGVEGVAIATAIANAIGAMAIVHLLQHETGAIRLHITQMRLHGRELKRMLQIGVPAGLQGMVFSLSNVILQSAINGYGAAAIAGSAAAVNFEYYCYFIIVGFNGAAISFIGQNYAAGRYDRVRRIYRACMAYAAAGCLAANLLFVCFHSFFLHLFTADAQVVHYGAIRMFVVLAFQWMACSYEISSSALRGMGESVMPAVLTIFGTCLLRVVWVFAVMPFYPGYERLLRVYPLSWILTGTMVVVFYIRYTRKHCRLQGV